MMTTRKARSQSCVSELAKLSPGNHVTQNLRVCFMQYVSKIEVTMCMQEKMNFVICHKDHPCYDPEARPCDSLN